MASPVLPDGCDVAASFLTRCRGSRNLRQCRCGDFGLVSRHKPAEHRIPDVSATPDAEASHITRRGVSARSTPLARREWLRNQRLTRAGERLRDQRLSRHHCVAVYTAAEAVFCLWGLGLVCALVPVQMVALKCKHAVLWWLLVRVFLEFVHWDTLMFAIAPGLSGGRGEMAMAVASPARRALFLHSTPDAVPLVPVQLQSMELPATTVGEWWRHHSLRRHKGGPWTVRIISCRHVLQGGF